MDSVEMISTLEEAGFSTSQAIAIAAAILGVKTKRMSHADVEKLLEKAGFNSDSAAALSKVFFTALAA